MALDPETRNVFVEVYKFFERSMPPRNEPEYWKHTADDMLALHNRFGCSPLAHDLLLACYEELARVDHANKRALLATRMDCDHADAALQNADNTGEGDIGA